MNFAQDLALQGIKDQANQFIPKELQEKEEDSKNLDVKDQKKAPPKKKKRAIDRALAIKMFSVLFIHTMIITVLLYLSYYKGSDKINEKTDKTSDYNWLIFAGCIIVSILLSLLVCYVQLVSKIFLNYLFYLVLLVLNANAFIWGGYKTSFAFHWTSAMLIMFDVGSLSVLFLSCFVRENPSTFWMMIGSGAGLLLTLMVVCKVYSDDKYTTFLFCALSFAIYEATAYNALDCFEHPEKKKNVPSMMTLPFELNLCFLKIIYYFLLLVVDLCKGCCCSNRSK